MRVCFWTTPFLIGVKTRDSSLGASVDPGNARAADLPRSAKYDPQDVFFNRGRVSRSTPVASLNKESAQVEDPLAVEVEGLAERCDPVPDEVVDGARAAFSAHRSEPGADDRDDPDPTSGTEAPSDAELARGAPQALEPSTGLTAS